MVVPVSFGTCSVSCTIYCNSMVRDRGEGGREGGRKRQRGEWHAKYLDKHFTVSSITALMENVCSSDVNLYTLLGLE